MYNPVAFQENDPAVLHQLIRDIGLATLVTSAAAGLDATPLPLLLAVTDSGTYLRGHVARANPVWRLFADNPNVLALFLGPHAYVTPQWYPSKREDGRVVPTWNYVTVHAHGTARAVDNAEWLRDNVTQLTAQHEQRFAAQWSIDEAPADFIAKMLAGIVGVEIAVSRLEGKRKLSQNRGASDQAGVVEGLAANADLGARATAAVMKV